MKVLSIRCPECGVAFTPRHDADTYQRCPGCAASVDLELAGWPYVKKRENPYLPEGYKPGA